MKSLYLKGSEETPEISFEKEKNVFRIVGKSYMEDAATFFSPVLTWLQEYKKDPNSITDFNFELEYVNTASTKIVHDIMSILDDIYHGGTEVVIHWKYFAEDEDMMELGQEYEEIYDLPFIFEKIEQRTRGNLFETD